MKVRNLTLDVTNITDGRAFLTVAAPDGAAIGTPLDADDLTRLGYHFLDCASKQREKDANAANAMKLGRSPGG